MKIKRFHAADIRQAIQSVREALGPDAVILSNRSVDGGVEIVAAVDYDEESVQAAAAGQEAVAAKPAVRRPAVPKRAVSAYQGAAEEAAMPRQKSAKGGNKGKTFREVVAQAAETQDGLEVLLSGSTKNRRLPREDNNPIVRQKKSRPQRKSEYTPMDQTPVEPVVSKPVEERRPVQEPVSQRSVRESASAELAQMQEELRSLRQMMGQQLSELAWDQMNRRSPDQVAMLRRLLSLGLDADMCREIADQVEFEPDPQRAWQMALKNFARRLPVASNDVSTQGGVLALVGPTGVGKTTSIAKLAARYVIRHGNRQVALISTDSYRIGAHEQLHQYARILDVPLRIADNAEELHDIINTFSDRNMVLIDTAGMGASDARLNEQFQLLQESEVDIRTSLVLSANTQRHALERIIPAWRKLNPQSCIITKTDESGSLGEVLSAVIRHELPITFFGDGQRVPEDLHLARASALVERAVKVMEAGHDAISDEFMAMAFGGLAVNAHASVNL